MAYTNSSMINMMVYLWKMVMFHSRPWTTTRGTPWKTSSSSQQVLQNTILGWTAQSSFWFHCQTVYCCNKIVGRTWWLVGWQEILSFKPMDQISCWSFYPWAWTGWFERWELWIKLKKSLLVKPPLQLSESRVNNRGQHCILSRRNPGGMFFWSDWIHSC